MPEMVNLAKLLKDKGIKIFILSNNFFERAAYYGKHFSFLREIGDRVYYSWQTGFVKPSANAYKMILDDNGLSAGECLYFDDVKKNVEVANSLGIHAFIFSGIQSIRDVIDRII